MLGYRNVVKITMLDAKKCTLNDDIDVCEKYNNSSDQVIDRLSKAKWAEVMNFIKCLPKNSILLDAGCGAGRNLLEAKKLGIDDITGFDFSEKMLNTTRSMFNDSNMPKLVLGDIVDIDKNFNPSSFDAIICIAVISHINTHERRVKAILNLINLLKPGGQLLLSFWSVDAIHESVAGDYIIRIDDIDWYYYMHTVETVINLIWAAIGNKTDVSWNLTDKHKNYYITMMKDHRK